MNKAARIILFILALWATPGPAVQAVLVIPGEAVEPASRLTGAEIVQDAPGMQGGRIRPGDSSLLSNPRRTGFPLIVQNEGGPGGAREDLEPALPEEGSPVGEGGLDAEFEEEFGKKPERSDPFEGYNRLMTSFNDFLYVWFYDPVSRAWRFIIPEFARLGIANFFDNILFPLRFVNNLLQAEILDAGEELLRFCINTTIGILGFWDAAEDLFGLEAHPEDFGQTLGVWGLGPGPHIVLPFLGPSNLRDSVALYPDYYLDPKSYIDPWEREYAVKVFERINYTSLHIGEYESLKKDALDLYPFLRDAYEQNRVKLISE